MKYDPDRAPDAESWLKLDEQEGIDLVRTYHRRHRIRLPNADLHAVFHLTVENQIAMGEPAIVEAMARLQRDGLSRHDAIHAIGSVLASHIHDIMHSKRFETADA
jgi:hypothetical protein